MIQYKPGGLNLLGVKGSVLPRTLYWAVPNVGATIFMFWYIREAQWSPTVDVTMPYYGYNIMLSFLVTWRTQQAYARWWEGGTLLQQARGEWFNAYSSTLAFCSRKDDMRDKVQAFQQNLVRLMSMLYCASLEQISQMETTNYEVIDGDSMDVESQRYLQESEDRVEVVMQWVQRHIVEGISSGVLIAAPPILSRVFQELGRGIVNINNVRKISEFLCPFPIVQMTTYLLLIHWFLTPVILAVILDKWYWSGLCSFLSVTALWAVNYIATEIEQPFGDDPNDLPMHEMQLYMNRTLLALVEERAQTIPHFSISELPSRPTSYNKVVGFAKSHTRMSQLNDPVTKTTTLETKERRTSSRISRTGSKSLSRQWSQNDDQTDEFDHHLVAKVLGEGKLQEMVPEAVQATQPGMQQSQMRSTSSIGTAAAASVAAAAAAAELVVSQKAESRRTDHEAIEAREKKELEEAKARLEQLQTSLDGNIRMLHRSLVEEIELVSALSSKLTRSAGGVVSRGLQGRTGDSSARRPVSFSQEFSQRQSDPGEHGPLAWCATLPHGSMRPPSEPSETASV